MSEVCGCKEHHYGACCCTMVISFIMAVVLKLLCYPYPHSHLLYYPPNPCPHFPTTTLPASQPPLHHHPTSQLLDFVRSGDGFTWHGCVYSAGMFLASISGMICMSHSFNLLYTAGMRAKTALTTAIYRKVRG